MMALYNNGYTRMREMRASYYLVSVPASVGWFVFEHEVDAGDDDDQHEGRGDKSPHDLPVQAGPHPRHVLDVPGEPLVAVHVHHGHQLREGDEGEPGGAEAVEEGEPVLAGAGGEDEADTEAGDGHHTNQDGLLHVLQAGLVEQGGDDPLQDPDLRAEAEGEQHHEEQGRPEGSSGDLGEDVRHDDEGESCSLGRVVQLSGQGAVLDGGVLLRVQSREETRGETSQTTIDVNPTYVRKPCRADW